MQTPPAGVLGCIVGMQQLLGFPSASLRAMIACSLCDYMLQFQQIAMPCQRSNGCTLGAADALLSS